MSLFDLSGAVRLLATNGTVTVKRPVPVAFTAGGFADAQSFTDLSIPGASVQPTNGRELVKPPEGTRPEETISIHAPAFALEVRDRLTVPGRGDFEVYHVDPWSEAGNFSRGLARKLNSSEPRP